jgi:hypothetical protein
MSMTFHDLRTHLKTYSTEQLKDIVENKLELSFIDYNEYSSFLDEKSCPSKETLLGAVLEARKKKLDDAFIPTPEHIRRMLDVNDQFFLSFEKARNEAHEIMKELDNRLENKDDFLKEYEIEVVLTPYIEYSNSKDERRESGCNIYTIISESDIYLRSRISSCQDNRYDIICWYFLDPDLNCNTDMGTISTFLHGYHINFALHELWENSFFSLEDIMNIGTIWIDVNVSHQGYLKLNYDNELIGKGKQP